MDLKYKKANLRKVANDQQHLTQRDQDLLYAILTKYEHLFNGTLGEWATEPVSLNMKEGAKSYSHKHYSTLRIHREISQKELKRLYKIGVLKEVRESQWGSLTFIIPKKDGRV